MNVVLTGGHVHDSEPAIELLKGVTLKGKTILADISTPASISNAILLSASFSELKITVTLSRASTNWLFALRISFYLLLLLFTFNLPTIPSRELFALREFHSEDHSKDFLTLGSMGHCSSIALGVALQQPKKKFWCLDGDGATLMHMGAMTTIGAVKPKNLIHIVLNNAAHKSVGGLPIVEDRINFPTIALACCYDFATEVKYPQELDEKLSQIKKRDCLSFLEIKCALGSRKNLGRPNASPVENKLNFMKELQSEVPK